MRNLFKALIAASILFACTASAAVDVEQTYLRSYDKYFTWSWACQLVRDSDTGSCVGLLAPKVQYEEMRYGLRGYYDAGDTIFINRQLRKGVDVRATLIHEMIHYIHVQNGTIPLPGPAKEVCWSENEAFTLVDLWLVTIGRPDKQRGDWWGAYPYCWNYYGPSAGSWWGIWIFDRQGLL